MPLAAQLILSFLWSVITSRIGQIAMAFVVAWFWNGWRTDDYWKTVIANEKAAAESAYRVELSRQQKASEEIAAAASERIEYDAEIERQLREQIDAFNAQENKNVPPRTIKQIIFKSRGEQNACRVCAIDGDYSRVVRRLDATARKAKPSRRAK